MSSTGASSSSSSTKSLTLTPAPEFRPRKNSPGASSSSSFTNPWTYDVFLSFRGDDTRCNFTGHLHSYLVQKGIKTFIDDELRRGEEISRALVKAIEGSRTAIVVFSENYASSTWCLDELVKILECRKLKQQIVWPLFYKVNPSDVRHQRGNFGRALADYAFKFKDNMEKVERWRTALTKAANLAGWTFSGGHESSFIKSIVGEVSAKVLHRTHLNEAKYPVGLERRVRYVEELLGVEENGVRVVGIWGMGGLGKTTLAKAVYNANFPKFEESCFLANVRERSSVYDGLVNQQKFLLSKILGGNELKVTNVDEGIIIMKERLIHKKVLLILDDVDDLKQLEALAGRSDWFGSGSRIIITTRDSRLLTSYQVNLIYKVEELYHDEALQLFSRHAFTSNRILDGYAELADAFVNCAQGLPLALEVLGQHLCGRSISQWQDALDSGIRVPNQEIKEILKISYDALDYQVKEILLDIGCFFKGYKKGWAMEILEDRFKTEGMNVRSVIEVLTEKALIKIDEDDSIQMHELLQEMVYQIVRQESPIEPGNRSRLWSYEDVHHVLTESTGTNQIQSVVLQRPEDSEAVEIRLNDESFLKMKNLRFLKIRHEHISGEVSYLPNSLRVLDWDGFPSQSLPSNFYPRNVVELKMRRSGISYLWKGLKVLKHLKSLNLKDCRFLTETPDLFEMPNLEVLNLSHCRSLVEVHHSVGFLDKLVTLKVKGCCNLKLFPRIVNLRSLKSIDFEDCSRLEKFPEIVRQMEALTWMNLSGTAIEEVPSSIGYLINLEELHLERCGNLGNISCSIFELQHLKLGFLSKCTKLGTFPELHGNSGTLAVPELRKLEMGGCNLSTSNFLATLDCRFTLEKLDLSGSNFDGLARCIGKFINLVELNLRGCARLREIPELPPKVEFVDAGDCVSLCSFSILSRILEFKGAQMIRWLDLSNCQKLCDNLVLTAKTKNILMNQVALFSLFLSSQRSAFKVVFPGSKVPKWFRCRKDLKDLDKCEFSIEIPQNFNWENKGLALCAAVDIYNSSVICSLKARIHMNEVCIYEHDIYLDSTHIQSDHVWMYYIPFLAMMSRIRQFNLVDTCRVSFVRTSQGSVCLKSCGVHLVKSQEEDISVEVSHEDTKSFGEEAGPLVVREDEYYVNHEDTEEGYFSFEDEEDNHQEPTNSQEAEGQLHSFQRTTKALLHSNVISCPHCSGAAGTFILISLAGPSLAVGATIVLVFVLSWSWLLSAWFHG